MRTTSGRSGLVGVPLFGCSARVVERGRVRLAGNGPAIPPVDPYPLPSVVNDPTGFFLQLIRGGAPAQIAALDAVA